MNRKSYPGIGLLLILAFWALVFAGIAQATNPPHHGDATANASQQQNATNTQAQSQDAAQEQSAAVAVDSGGPSLGLLLGGGSSGSDSTAPCLERRPSWGFGFRGDKTKLNAVCWGEYVRAAEHARELELARLELERLRLEIERERLAIERAALDLCFECEVQK